jgi:Flp pilus assembly protein protease CpaA
MPLSEKVVAGLEDFFGWYGRKVAAHPLPIIVFCLVATGLSAIGVLRYRYSTNRIQYPPFIFHFHVFCLLITGFSAIGVLRYRYSINRTKNPLFISSSSACSLQDSQPYGSSDTGTAQTGPKTHFSFPRLLSGRNRTLG